MSPATQVVYLTRRVFLNLKDQITTTQSSDGLFYDTQYLQLSRNSVGKTDLWKTLPNPCLRETCLFGVKQIVLQFSKI